MFKIQSIDHIVLRSDNIQKMVTFYVEILGCTIDKINHEVGITHLRANNNLIDILKVKEKPQDKNLEHFCLRISPFNYNELETYFKQHSIEILRFGNRYSALGYGNSFYIKDPDGNEVEFIEDKIS